MNDISIGKALIELSDLMICASNDFHHLHFNVRGNEFDTLHAKILKDYYEAAANDHDELAEKAGMFNQVIPNANGAKMRINYDCVSVETFDDATLREGVLRRTRDVLDKINNYFYKCFCLFNEIKEVRCIGIANYLQTRIEYWSKEQFYFNDRRLRN